MDQCMQYESEDELLKCNSSVDHQFWFVVKATAKATRNATAMMIVGQTGASAEHFYLRAIHIATLEILIAKTTHTHTHTQSKQV